MAAKKRTKAKKRYSATKRFTVKKIDGGYAVYDRKHNPNHMFAWWSTKRLADAYANSYNVKE
jgi:hypothetical protein